MLNNCIVSNHLNNLGLSGKRVTLREIKERYKQIAEVFNPETFDADTFKKIQESYTYLKKHYVQVKDYINGIPVYEVELKLSDIYCNRLYYINGIEFKACSSCLKSMNNYQTCILLYKVHSDYGFKYNGIDLLYTLDINSLDALVGIKKTITLLDNSLFEITVPPLSSNETVITVPKLGLSNSTETGNLYIKICTYTPTLDSSALLELKKFIDTHVR